MKNRRQRGQTLVIFALVLGLFMVGMLALLADVGALFVAYNRADDAALLAGQAGASAIDVRAFRGGTLALDQPEAEDRCQHALEQAGASGTCAVTPERVTVEVGQEVSLPVTILGFNARVRVTHTAQPAFGGTTAVVGT